MAEAKKKEYHYEGLEQKVDRYFELNTQEKEIKNEKDPLNASIKEEMRARGIEEFDSGRYTAKSAKQERTKMNPDKLLAKLKELGLTQAIKVVEQPDEAMVEELIYNKQLDPADLASCIDVNIVEVLTVKANKKAKSK